MTRVSSRSEERKTEASTRWRRKDRGRRATSRALRHIPRRRCGGASPRSPRGGSRNGAMQTRSALASPRRPRGPRRADVRETCGCTRRRCAALPRSDRPGQLHDHVAGCSQVVRAARTRAASACSFPSSRPPNILRCKEAEISLHRPFNARAENASDRFGWAVPAPIHHSVSDEASVAALARYVSYQHSISVHCVVHCHCLSVNRSSPGIFLAFFSSPLR